MYSTPFSASSNRYNAGRNRNLIAHTTTRVMGPVTTTFLLAVIIAVLALLYLTQITKTSVYGYKVNNLDAQRKDLIAHQQGLEIEAARLQALANVQTKPVVGTLTNETNPQFINQ